MKLYGPDMESATPDGHAPVDAEKRRQRSQSDEPEYNAPDDWANLHEVATASPVEHISDSPVYRHRSLEQSLSRDHNAPTVPSPSGGKKHRRRSQASAEPQYDAPNDWANLDEVAAPSPVENFTDSPIYRHTSLEQIRSLRQDGLMVQPQVTERGDDAEKQTGHKVSKLATQIYTLSYLVFFAIFGTLARLGIAALTHYVDAPVIFSTVWANFGGSVVMGFLAEDRMLFRHEWGSATYDKLLARAKVRNSDEETGSGSGSGSVDLAAAKKAHLSVKKTIPLYVGLATGFCGSFTSFSTFIRDMFLAMSNDMVAPGFGTTAVSRNGGYSFMALLSVLITTVSLSLSGLVFGAHLAIATERYTPTISYPITRKIIDPLFVVLGWGCWLGAILMSIFPPHDQWRQKALFALVFAPLGCLARFYLALLLNGKMASFPMGTFAANVSGTVILAMAWDVAHVDSGGLIGCQVLQGIEDGFCGCLTTVSTWVAELNSLRRRNSYVYGTVSVIVSFGLMVIIMGSLRWTQGWAALKC